MILAALTLVAAAGVTYAELRMLTPEGATRWLVATYAAECRLSDGYFDQYEKWDERADRIGAIIRTGKWGERDRLPTLDS